MPVNRALVFNATAIRNTSPQTGDVIFNGDFIVKTIIVENGLNQAVSLQCQGSANADFSNSFNLGPSWDVAASTNTYMTCDTYIPYFRIIATCAVAPTSGELNVIVLGV